MSIEVTRKVEAIAPLVDAFLRMPIEQQNTLWKLLSRISGTSVLILRAISHQALTHIEVTEKLKLNRNTIKYHLRGLAAAKVVVFSEVTQQWVAVNGAKYSANK